MNELINPTDCLLETSIDGKEIFRLKFGEKWVYIGSKYSVERDVNNIIKKIDEYCIGHKLKFVIVFGLGTGEHIIKLLNKYPELSIYIVEPSKFVLENFEKTKNHKEVNENTRVECYCFDGDENGLIKFLSKFINEFNLDDFLYFSYANYENIFGELYIKFLKTLKEFIINLRISINTNLKFTKIWYDAFVRNILNMPSSQPVDEIKNLYRSKPAIIVSAGPSLEKNVHLLKEAQDKFIIITGGRTLKTLLDLGIKPDFVVVIDPVEKTYKLLKPVLGNESPLIYYEGTNPDVVNEYRGEKYYFVLNDFTKKILGREVSPLLTGGSVAITCLGLALHLGCDPIVFIGQDLAYTNDKLHSDNAKLNEEINKIDDPNSFYVDDIFGNKVRTNYSLNSFRKIIEYYIGLYDNKLYINATEGGANINGTKIMKLSDVIDNYSDKCLIKHLRLTKQEMELDCQVIKNKLYKVLTDFKLALNKCNQGKHLSLDLYTIILKGDLSNKKINRINKKLDEIDKNLIEVFEEGGFANFIFYPIIKEVLSEENYKILNTDNEFEKAKKIALKSEKLYSDLSEKIVEAIEILEKYLNN